jgi:hypothetical protein
MAQNVSKAVGKDYRGVAIPHPGFKYENLSSTDTSIYQISPLPGVPQAQQVTDMVVETSGVMGSIELLTAPNDARVVCTTQRGGMPGVQDARFVYSQDVGNRTGQTTFGCESPNAISSYKLVTANGPPNGCITLQSQVVLLGTIVAGVPQAQRKTPFVATGSRVAFSWAASALPVPPGSSIAVVAGTVCFFQLPQGRVHAYYLIKDSSVATREYYQLVMCWSDDEGVTWRGSNRYALNDQMPAMGVNGAAADGFDIKRARVAYSNGQALLLVHATAHDTNFSLRDSLFQYASADLGHSFDLIDLSGGTRNDGAYIADTTGAALGSDNGCAYPDICVLKNTGGFGVSYARVNNTAGNLGSTMWKELGSAYSTWVQVDPTLIEGGTHGSISLQVLIGTNTTCAVDDNGIVLVSWQVDSVGQSSSRISYDGVYWTDIVAELSAAGTGSTWWATADADFHPNGYCSTFQYGRCLVLSEFYTSEEQGAVADGKVWEIALGGYSTATRPHKDSEEKDDRELTWETNWAWANRMSTTTGWAAAGTGTETIVAPEGSRVLTTAGQTKTLTNTALSAVSGGALKAFGVFEARVSAGAAHLEVLLGDGANVVQLWFELNTTNFLVKDIIAGTVLYNAAIPDVSGAAVNVAQVYWGMDYADLSVSCWVRNATDETGPRQWVRALNHVAIAAGASVAASRVRVEQAENTTSYWRDIHWGSGVYGRSVPLDGTNSPAQLYGRTWSPFPINIFPQASGGLRVSAVDGPTWSKYDASTPSGDSWVIDTRFEFGIENVFPDVSPSPRRTWRGVTNFAQDIAVNIGEIDTDPAPGLGRVLVVGAFNCNVQKIEVHYRIAAGGALTLLGTIDFSQGMTGLTWIRDGKMVRPASGTAVGAEYFTYNILEDSHFRLTSAGPVDRIRRIATNHEGLWSRGTTVRTTLYCDDITGTENTTAATGEIWVKDGVLMIRDAPDIYQIVFRIPSGVAYGESFPEIGNLFVGHLAYFGKQYARGRALTTEPNTELTTMRGGARRSRNLGPARRSVEFAWANENLTDASQLSASVIDPDYILPATGAPIPVATPADTAWKMAGLVEALRGAATPCLYLAKVPMVSNENVDTMQTNRNLFLYGRITGGVRIETVLGNEWGNPGELVRVAAISFEEEL